LYAEAKNCNVLKQEAMDYLIKNMEKMLGTGSFDKLYQSKELTKEIMFASSKRTRLEE
jgi:hypothetical protein